MNYDTGYAANEKTKKKGVGSVHISRGLWPWAGACTRCPTTLHGARPFWQDRQNGFARPSNEGDYSLKGSSVF